MPTLELSSELPLYESIKRELQTRIERGDLPEGTRILPEIELAKQIGVSRSTARKALQALEIEGYISRTAGRGSFVKTPPGGAPPVLAAGKGTLAITLYNINRYNHTGQIMQGFMHEAVSLGHHATVHPPNPAGVDEFEYLLNVRRSGIQGWALWLMSASEKVVGLLRNFQRSGCSLVLVDRYARNLDSDFVVTDNGGMAYALTRELIRRGHREIGLITFPLESTVGEDRYSGHRRALEEAGIPWQDDLVVVDHISGVEPLRMQMLSLLGRRKRPTAVFCASEHHAPWLIKELQRLGYTIPGDIELAIIDDNRFAETQEFPILYATQHSFEMGVQAAKLLAARLDAPQRDPQGVFLNFDLSFTPST